MRQACQEKCQKKLRRGISEKAKSGPEKAPDPCKRNRKSVVQKRQLIAQAIEVITEDMILGKVRVFWSLSSIPQLSSLAGEIELIISPTLSLGDRCRAHGQEWWKGA